MNALISLATCYLLFSVPLFGTHLALAGYADIWMAGFAGLGFMALVRGAAEGLRSQTILGFLMVALAMLVKNEGVVWFLAALLMQVLLSFRWRTNMLAGMVLAAVVLAGYLLDVTHVEIPLAGTLGVVNDRLEIPFVGSFALEVHDVWQVYWTNFFTMGSWNFLWVLVAFGLLLAVISGKSLASPVRRAGAIFVVMFLATQLFIFGFTDQGVWADTYTAINRLPLHFVPALIYTAVAMVRERIMQADPVSAAPEANRA
jgi:hypothetical protein